MSDLLLSNAAQISICCLHICILESIHGTLRGIGDLFVRCISFYMLGKSVGIHRFSRIYFACGYAVLIEVCLYCW